MHHVDKRRVFALYLQGYSFRQIGREVGISQTWAQQIVSPPTEIRKRIAAKARNHCRRCKLYARWGRVHDPNARGLELDDFSDIDALEWLCAACHRAAHGAEHVHRRLSA